jgi:hypothetical protein
MKQIYALLFSLFLFSASCFSQYLATNSTEANPLLRISLPVAESQPLSPEWQKDQDLVNGHISNSRLVKMRNVTEAIVGYFQDSCIMEGEYGPVWHGEYFADGRGSGKEMKFGIQCNFEDQKARLTILSNDMRSLLMEPLVVNNQQFLAIRPVSGSCADCPYFEYAAEAAGSEPNADHSGTIAGQAGEGKPLRNRVWLVATGNQLPYVAVSRAEYLKEARLELTVTRNAIIADMKKNMPLRSAAMQETDKKAALDQLAALYSGTDLQVRTKMFLNHYKTDEDYQKENIDKGTAELDSTLALMDRLQSRSTSAELDMPAIVSVSAAEFRGFEDGQDSKMLIRINPAYLAAAGSADAPRFLLVRWQYDPSEPKAGGIDKQILARFDGRKLKGALR